MGTSGGLKGVRAHKVNYKDRYGTHNDIVCDAHLSRVSSKPGVIIKKHATSVPCEYGGEHRYSKP